MEHETIRELSHAFGRKLRSEDEVLNIRLCLAAYICSRADQFGHKYAEDGSKLTKSRNTFDQLPKKLDNLRLQYREVRKDNLKVLHDQDKTTRRLQSPELGNVYGARQTGSLAACILHLRALELSRQLNVLQRHTQMLHTGLTKGGLRPGIGHNNDQPHLDEDLHNDSFETDRYSTIERMLQRTSLQAKHRWDREKRLLARVKSRSTRDIPEGKAGSRARLQAFSATREELAHWLEVQLSQHNDVETEPHLHSIATISVDTIKPQEDISSCYHVYVTACKRLLRTAHNAACRLRNPEPVSILRHEISSTPTTTALLSSINLVQKQMVPLVLQQRATAAQLAYRSSWLVQEKLDANEVIDRLVDESHLLLTHPSRSMTMALCVAAKQDSDVEVHQPETVSMRLETWALAAEKAGQALELLIANCHAHARVLSTSIQKNMLDMQIYGGDQRSFREAEHGQHLPRSHERRARRNQWSKLHGHLGPMVIHGFSFQP